MFTYVRTWIIEWGDCDPAGIVYFPRFFAAFDTSTHRLLEAALGKRAADIIRENGITGWPLVDISARFMRPASFGDAVEIETRVTRVGKSSFSLAHRLTYNNDLCIEVTEVRVWAAPRADGAPGIAAVPFAPAVAAALRGESGGWMEGGAAAGSALPV